MVFLRFLAKSTHLQLLSDEDYKKLTTEMPAAFDALYGNVKSSHSSPTAKGIFSVLFNNETNFLLPLFIKRYSFSK
jgi:hypothetical protein